MFSVERTGAPLPTADSGVPAVTYLAQFSKIALLLKKMLLDKKPDHWSYVFPQRNIALMLYQKQFTVCLFSVSPIDQTGDGQMKISSIPCYGPIKYTCQIDDTKYIVGQTDLAHIMKNAHYQVA